VTPSSRPSRAVIIDQLKLASKKGDRVALALAVEHMKLWAYSPRYWQKYLQLLTHPLARLVDLTVIKQGDKIARQKGWVQSSRRPSKPPVKRRPADTGRRRARRARAAGSPAQPSLFPELAP
jgi:hypothetical protein